MRMRPVFVSIVVCFGLLVWLRRHRRRKMIQMIFNQAGE